MGDTQGSASSTYSNFCGGLNTSQSSSPTKCSSKLKKTLMAFTSTPKDEGTSIPKSAQQPKQQVKVTSTAGVDSRLRKHNNCSSLKKKNPLNLQATPCTCSKKNVRKVRTKDQESPVWTSSNEAASTEVQVGSEIESGLSRPTETHCKSSNQTGKPSGRNCEAPVKSRKIGMVIEKSPLLDDDRSRSQMANVDPNTLARSSVPSPVDFVDHAIAIVKRDNASNNQKKSKPGPICSKKLLLSQSSSKDEDSDDSIVPDTPPLPKKRRVQPPSDSSETEFEQTQENIPRKQHLPPLSSRRQTFDRSHINVSKPNVLEKCKGLDLESKAKSGPKSCKPYPVGKVIKPTSNSNQRNFVLERRTEEQSECDKDLSIINIDISREGVLTGTTQHLITSQVKEGKGRGSDVVSFHASDVQVKKTTKVRASVSTSSQDGKQAESVELHRLQLHSNIIDLSNSPGNDFALVISSESSISSNCLTSEPLTRSINHCNVLPGTEKNKNHDCHQHIQKDVDSQHERRNLEIIDTDESSNDENIPVECNADVNCATTSTNCGNVKTTLLPTLRVVMSPLHFVKSAVSSVAQMLSPAAAVAAAHGDERVRLCSILKGVVAYVEVRSGHDNRSMGVRTQLRALGAHVVEKFSKEVTHVIFNEGLPSTLKRARDQNCHVVSVLWIEECKNVGCLVRESDYPAFGLDKYDSITTNKYRKLRSLQPDFEEGKSDDRIKKLLTRIKAKETRNVEKPEVNLQISQVTAGTQCKAHREIGVSTTSSSIKRKKVQNGEGAVKVPVNVILKDCNVVMDRLPTCQYGGSPQISFTQRKQKKKLMPIQRETSNVSTLEDFDPRERLRPPCPYIEPKNTQSQRSQQATNTTRVTRGSIKSSDKATEPKSFTAVPISKEKNHKVSKRPTQKASHRTRKSSFIFQGKNQRARRPSAVARKKERQQKKLSLRTMVCTYMHRRDIDVVAAVLKKLGGWKLEPTVTYRTSHVVCGDAKRTINLLRGIAYGCWILHQEWVMRSLEANKWLDEEPFEITDFPAVQQCRVARETLRARPEIFNVVGSIYVAENTSPPREDIKELLRLFGGRVATITRYASIIVGKAKRCVSEDVPFVREEWVLDSIQENMVLPITDYRL